VDGAKLAVGLGLIGAIAGAGFVLLKPKQKAPMVKPGQVGGVDSSLPPVTVQVATGYAPVIYAAYDGSKIGTHLNLLNGFRYQGTVFYA
jgi:hypothetical protein